MPARCYTQPSQPVTATSTTGRIQAVRSAFAGFRRLTASTGRGSQVVGKAVPDPEPTKDHSGIIDRGASNEFSWLTSSAAESGYRIEAFW